MLPLSQMDDPEYTALCCRLVPGIAIRAPPPFQQVPASQRASEDREGSVPSMASTLSALVLLSIAALVAFDAFDFAVAAVVDRTGLPLSLLLPGEVSPRGAGLRFESCWPFS